MKWIKAEADLYKINNRNKVIIIENNYELDILLKMYSQKFRFSADRLTEHLFRTGDISKLDFYFFAIAYLYRHSIELILKAIAFQYIVEKEERSEFLKRTKHNLHNILLEIKPHVKLDINVDEESFQWLLSFFLDINEIDRESDSFRYPFAISTKRDIFNNKIYSIHPVFTKQTHIDLVKFSNKMITAYEILDSLYRNMYGDYKRNDELKPILIEEGGSYYGQSVVGYKYSSIEFYPYVKAYTDSAKFLNKLISKDETLKDYLFMPMCYLYRNAVEISLKEILFEECSFELQEALKLMNKKKHRILGLWNLIKDEIVEHANPSKGDNTAEHIYNYLNGLNNIDGAADLFRYPFGKSLNVYFRKKRKFDIDNVYNFFEELLSFFRGVNGMMADLKAEWEAEVRSEMSYYDY